MSFAVLGNNQTIKINASISNSLATPSGTLHTAPANGYSIVQVSTDTAQANAVTILIGGQEMLTYDPSNNVWTGQQGTGVGSAMSPSIYVGPSQPVSFTNNASVIKISGVSFINSP